MTDPVASKEMTLEDALELCRKHAAWFPNVPSVSRALIREIERLQVRVKELEQLASDHGLNNLEDRDEYDRCRSLDDKQIVREAMETPIRMVHELGNRYDVVCEKLDKLAEPPSVEQLAKEYLETCDDEWQDEIYTTEWGFTNLVLPKFVEWAKKKAETTEGGQQ